jgi:hypothetical protein
MILNVNKSILFFSSAHLLGLQILLSKYITLKNSASLITKQLSQKEEFYLCNRRSAALAYNCSSFIAIGLLAFLSYRDEDHNGMDDHLD